MKYRCILKQILDSKGLTQKWLAAQADIEEASLSRYINNQRGGNVLIWLKISRVLGITVNDLFVKDDVFRYKEVE